MSPKPIMQRNVTWAVNSGFPTIRQLRAEARIKKWSPIKRERLDSFLLTTEKVQTETIEMTALIEK